MKFIKDYGLNPSLKIQLLDLILFFKYITSNDK